jgi:hypothetical protein
VREAGSTLGELEPLSRTGPHFSCLYLISWYSKNDSTRLERIWLDDDLANLKREDT